MKKIKVFIFFSLLCVKTLTVSAQKSDDSRNNRNFLEMSGSLYVYGSEPAYGFGFSYYWYPIHYVGLGSGVFVQKWKEIARDVLPYKIVDNQNQKYEFDDNQEVIKLGLYMGPSFRSPSFRIGKTEDVRMFLQSNPSLLLTIPNNSYTYSYPFLKDGKLYKNSVSIKNRGGKWCFWQVRTSVSLAIDQLIISIGYGISDFEPHADSRNMVWNNQNISLPNSKYAVSHELYVSAAYSF